MKKLILISTLTMKKLILILTLSTLIFSCTHSDNSSNNNNNSSSGNTNYYFKININGVEHKVQGNTSNINGYVPNQCYASIGTSTSLYLSIEDITQPNYVSGQNLQIQVIIPNCHVGQNQASVNILSSPVYYSSVNSFSNTCFLENSGVYCTNSNCQGPLYSSIANKITLNITDMGTPSPIYSGNTFKGNYSGPIYFTNDSFGNNTNSVSFDIPMQFSMEFEAYRN